MAYGGQAVIEGVMMRSKSFMTIAVRLENGSIKVKRQLLKENPTSSIFFIRGIFNLVDTLKLGFSALNWSARQQINEEFSKGESFLTVITFVLSMILAVSLFKLFPLFIAKVVSPNNIYLLNLVDGIIKLTIFIGYIWIISFFSDVRRIFQYHGAEHKAIGCLEENKELNIANCLYKKKEHKRCGTNFLFTVIFISMIVYLLIPLQLGFWYNLILRLLLLPVIAGFSYELIKLSGKFDNLFTTIISYPGILIQKLTTYEPDNKQLEVGIVALKELLKLENQKSL